ncbi:MAG: four helix bundle protein [Actinomycetota bacterium]|nr:four helix bundle protein [Actinomycetota bacterium]
MKDRLENNDIYQKAVEIYNKFLEEDLDILRRDYCGREVGKQLICSLGSISSNIEEGYGRGFGKEYIYFLRVARGSARESKGWYQRSKKFLPPKIIDQRVKALDEIISMLVVTVNKLETKIRPSSLDLP